MSRIMPDFKDMIPKQVCEWGMELVGQARSFGEMRATLIVNCMPGRPLHKLGIFYDESRPALANMVAILESLTEKAKQGVQDE